jgi:hypothetical protein
MNLDDDENFHNEEIFNVDLYNLVAPIIAVFLSIRDETIPIRYLANYVIVLGLRFTSTGSGRKNGNCPLPFLHQVRFPEGATTSHKIFLKPEKKKVLLLLIFKRDPYFFPM